MLLTKQESVAPIILNTPHKPWFSGFTHIWDHLGVLYRFYNPLFTFGPDPSLVSTKKALGSMVSMESRQRNKSNTPNVPAGQDQAAVWCIPPLQGPVPHDLPPIPCNLEQSWTSCVSGALIFKSQEWLKPAFGEVKSRFWGQMWCKNLRVVFPLGI